MYKVIAAIVIFLIVLGGSFGAGYAVRGAKCESDALLIEKASLQAGNKATEASTKAIAKIRQTQTTIKQEVQREISQKPEYRDCLHDDGVVRNINGALSGQPPD